MAEFKITRFRYTWKGDWNSSTETYYKDDVVFYQGSSWVCVRQHEPTVFADDLSFTVPGNTQASPAWIKMTEGRKFVGEWTNGQQYDSGVLVLSGGNVYLCLQDHVSSNNFSDNILYWELFAAGSNFRNQWTPNTRYRVNDVIRYNGYTYQCVLEHSSSSISDGIIIGNDDSTDDSTFETWKTLIENYAFVGNYQANTRYRQNDLVKYGGSILKCITEHTSPNVNGSIVSENFEIYLSGFEFDQEWSSNAYYAIGDVVKLGGVIYVAAENNFNSKPENTNLKWTLIQNAFDFKGQFDPQSKTLYNTGDLVRRGGSLWLSLKNQVIDEDSTLEVLDDSNWQMLHRPI